MTFCQPGEVGKDFLRKKDKGFCDERRCLFTAAWVGDIAPVLTHSAFWLI